MFQVIVYPDGHATRLPGTYPGEFWATTLLAMRVRKGLVHPVRVVYCGS